MCTVYFFVYFHRVSTSVIAEELLETFSTNATSLGIMSSMYFYVYALEQPFVGYLSDRIGPKRVVGIWTLIAAAGSVIFGMAPTIFWASAGRAMIGLGVGGVYVPALKSFSQWFSSKNFATLTGIFMASGNLGAIVATTPLVWMTCLFGWRISFFIIAAITLLLALATLFFMQDHPSMENNLLTPSETRHEIHADKKPIFRTLLSFTFWGYAVILFVTLGTLITMQGLWATPFLISAYNIDLTTASGFNMLIPIGFILASPFWGWIDDRFFKNKTNLLVATLLVMSVVWAVLTMPVPDGRGLIGIAILMLVMGATGGGILTTLWSSLQKTIPENIFGSISGLLNPFPLFGVAVFQGLTGAILDSVGKVGKTYPTNAFRSAFLLCFAATVVSVLFALAIKYSTHKKKVPGDNRQCAVTEKYRC
jgi:sugar phosphate permease